jgi:hypothetical protein
MLRKTINEPSLGGRKDRGNPPFASKKGDPCAVPAMTLIILRKSSQ